MRIGQPARIFFGNTSDARKVGGTGGGEYRMQSAPRITTPIDEWISFAKQHPHEFTIQYPPRREYFMEHFRTEPHTLALTTGSPLLLYLHVPFCEAKCHYCNFSVVVSDKEDLHRRYVHALNQELSAHLPALHGNVTGIDIGGGTPTLLNEKLLESLLAPLPALIARSTHPFPISIETTPSIAAESPDKMMCLASLGVNRISMGIQSFNEETLAGVNRHKQIEKTQTGMDHLRRAGFKRINLDVIFGLPGQSVSDWENDLSCLIALKPDSITTYDCLYRGKGRAITLRPIDPPSAETYGKLYDRGYDRLIAAGYTAPYGSVNFSLRSQETGTSAYFEGRLLDGAPYLGVGNYATSWVEDRWTFNHYSLVHYLKAMENGVSPIQDHYLLPFEELSAKYILYSLNYGMIDTRRFEARFGRSFDETYETELKVAQDEGWLSREAHFWRVPYHGFQHLFKVRSLFYPERARTWLTQVYRRGLCDPHSRRPPRTQRI